MNIPEEKSASESSEAADSLMEQLRSNLSALRLHERLQILISMTTFSLLFYPLIVPGRTIPGVSLELNSMLSRLYPIFWIPGLDYFWGKVLAVFCVVQILLIITLRWTRLSMGMDYLNPLLIVCLLIESGIASSDLSFGITVMRNEYLVRGPNWLTFSWGIYFLLAMVLVHFIAAWMLPDIAAQEDMNREAAIRRRKRRRKSKRFRIASAAIEEETE